jgi:hypothetical protein
MKMQQWYKDQMDQNGFGAKTFIVETEDDGVTPLVHVVHVPQTDEMLWGADRGGLTLWSNTMVAAGNAGITLWSPGEVWIVIPETHVMLPDGTVIGEVALGTGAGNGNGAGLCMMGSKALSLYYPEYLTDDRIYDGLTLPAIGPYAMKHGITFPWFEGTTISSVTSSLLGALFHETAHAFGIAHDFRNDANFHGNLMGNGLRGIRGGLLPERYPEDYTRLEYASALILNVSHFFNRDKSNTTPPHVSSYNPNITTPKQGLIYVAFEATDEDSLSLASLGYGGGTVAEMLLKGTATDTAFAVPYFTPASTNVYTLSVYDKQGNKTYYDLDFHVLSGRNQAPIPHIRVTPPVPGENEVVELNAAESTDADHPISSVVATWDVDNDGQFDTEPSTEKRVQYMYENPGNYLIRVKLTDPEGDYYVSTPVSVRIPGQPKPAVKSFTLINADQNSAVVQLVHDTEIDLVKWSRDKFSIRADVSDNGVDSVSFHLLGPISFDKVEKTEPYALFGDSPRGNFAGKKLLAGEYTLTAIPYKGSIQGIALTISFRVVTGTTVASIVKDKTIGSSTEDYLHSVIFCEDGGYLLAGTSAYDSSGDKSQYGFGSYDFWIVKLDGQLNKQWDKTYGRDNADSLVTAITTNDGGYLLAGNTTYPSGEEVDYYLIRVDNQGNRLWERTYGAQGKDILRTAVQAPDGDFLLGGDSEAKASGDKSDDTRGANDFWIIRIDEAGNIMWDKTFGGSDEESLGSIAAAPDGWLLGGSSRSDVSGDKTDNGKGSLDFWIVRIDDAGNKIWDKTIGSSGRDALGSVLLTDDQHYLLAGTTYFDRSNSDLWLVKVNGQGVIQWDKTIGGDSIDVFGDLISMGDGGFLLGATSRSPVSGDKSENSTWYDYWVVKIDANGNKAWDKTIGGRSTDSLSAMALTDKGTVLLGGTSTSDASMGDKSEDTKGICETRFCPPDFWVVELMLPTKPVVVGLTLINSHTDKEISGILIGDVINLAELGTSFLNIRADVSGVSAGKVVFELDGPFKHRRLDRSFPYSLFGDHDGDFAGRKLLPGMYRLSVSTYVNEAKAHTLSISFTVRRGFEISGFTLIDATTDKPLRMLSENDVIDLSSLGGHKLSIRAETFPEQLEKVILALTGPVSHSTTEHFYPYALFGDSQAKNGSVDYGGTIFFPGNYTVTAIPFMDGVRGPHKTISFSVKWNKQEEKPCVRFDIYPNPATCVVHIKLYGVKSQAFVMLIDANGPVMLKRPLDEHMATQLDVSDFRRGIYYVKVISSSGTGTNRLVLR